MATASISFNDPNGATQTGASIAYSVFGFSLPNNITGSENNEGAIHWNGTSGTKTVTRRDTIYDNLSHTWIISSNNGTSVNSSGASGNVWMNLGGFSQPREQGKQIYGNVSANCTRYYIDYERTETWTRTQVPAATPGGQPTWTGEMMTDPGSWRETNKTSSSYYIGNVSANSITVYLRPYAWTGFNFEYNDIIGIKLTASDWNSCCKQCIYYHQWKEQKARNDLIFTEVHSGGR